MTLVPLGLNACMSDMTKKVQIIVMHVTCGFSEYMYATVNSTPSVLLTEDVIVCFLDYQPA